MAHQIDGFPHSIGIIKRVFGFQQVTHRRLAKNLHRLEVSAVGTQIAQSIVFQRAARGRSAGRRPARARRSNYLVAVASEK